jgi:hypothetical protein
VKLLIGKVAEFWFTPAPATRLAALRLLTGAFALWYLLPRYALYSRVVDASPELFEPVGLASMLSSPMPVGVFRALLLLLYGLNLLFLLGWRQAVCGPAFGLLLLFVLCYRNSWAMIYHSDNLLVLHILILGFTRASDAWSLDAWRRGRREALRPDSHSSPLTLHSSLPPLWHYGWPLRLICAVTVSTYFLAGVAKVAGPLGWSWAGGEALRSQMAVDGLRKELLGEGASPMIFQLYDQVWLFTLLGMLTLLLELGAPLALVHRWVGRSWAVGAWLMHWGILLLMDIQFEYSLSGIVFAAFFPLERLMPGRLARCVHTVGPMASSNPGTAAGAPSRP